MPHPGISGKSGKSLPAAASRARPIGLHKIGHDRDNRGPPPRALPGDGHRSTPTTDRLEALSMKAWIATGVALVAWFGPAGAPAIGQVVERERDVSVTGPRGRTIERQVRSERGPGFVDRQVEIHRPGGTVRSDVFAHRVPGYAG